MTRDSDPDGTRALSSGSGASGQADRFVHEHLPPRGQWPQFVYGLPELQIADRANLVDVLFRKAFDNGLADRPFLRSDRITLTYADALERVRRIAQVLTEDFPLVPGHRVLLRGGNSIGMALAWLGVVYAGMVAVATMPLLRAKELGDIIEKARPRSEATISVASCPILPAESRNFALTVIASFNKSPRR